MSGGAEFEKLLREQGELITREQALGHGISDRQIRLRVDSGKWFMVARGVYLVSAREFTRELALKAALLHAGPNAVLSHRSAAYAHSLWGFTPPPPEAKSHDAWMKGLHETPIEVTVPFPEQPNGNLFHPQTRRRVPVRIRMSRREIWRAEVQKDGTTLACTSIARTVLDLAQAFHQKELGRAALACAFEAAVNRGEWIPMLWACEAEAAGRPHVQTVVELLTRHGPYNRRVESPAEAVLDDAFWNAGLIAERQYELTLPSRRAVRADFLFVDERLIVEVEGTQYHGHRELSRDRPRHNGLVRLGFTPLYYSAMQVMERPQSVVDEVIADLKARGRKFAPPKTRTGSPARQGSNRTTAGERPAAGKKREDKRPDLDAKLVAQRFRELLSIR